MKNYFITAAIALTIGTLFGHFVWGATRVEVATVEYDIVANDKKCKEQGGHIVAKLIPDYYLLPPEYVAVRYECFIPSKTIKL
jgi:hypothetical protein